MDIMRDDHVMHLLINGEVDQTWSTVEQVRVLHATSYYLWDGKELWMMYEGHRSVPTEAKQQWIGKEVIQ